jgi:PKHD-type hydroxylase
MQAYVRDALTSNFLFQFYTRPVRWSRLLFSVYHEGQAYGRHYDNWNKRADDNGRMRSDVSFTLFLSEPESYEGGELVLERPEGALTVKMPAGSIFVYPTGVIHQVLPVTSGTRRVCVGWIQSHIRSFEQRELLFDLECILHNLEKGEPRKLLDKSIGSLLRMWAEI